MERNVTVFRVMKSVRQVDGEREKTLLMHVESVETKGERENERISTSGRCERKCKKKKKGCVLRLHWGSQTQHLKRPNIFFKVLLNVSF